MPPDRRLLREIRSMNRGMWRYQREAGQWAWWFRFNPTASTSDPTYGTGPQRAWYPPIKLPVLIGERSRAPENFDDAGLYLVDRLHLIISYDAFFHSTMPDPDPYGVDHLRDRVAFDNVLFAVNSFFPRGRTASYFLTISVDLIEVAQEELDEDAAVPMFAPYIDAS